MNVGSIFEDFESLGDNCEFGLAQRYVGIEPLGLFRFSFSAKENLIHALSTKLVYYGSEDDLEIYVAKNGEYICTSKKYGFAYHTAVLASQEELYKLRRRELKKVSFLKERLIRDLTEGTKIFVRKGPPTESLKDARRIIVAMRKYGPAPLLWVVETADPNLIGRVLLQENGLLLGYIRRFAPYDNAHDIWLEDWVDICCKARIAWGMGDPEHLPDASKKLFVKPCLSGRHFDSACLSLEPPFGRHNSLSVHVVLKDSEAPMVADARMQVISIPSHKIATYSVSVMLPANFDGALVGPSFNGLPRLFVRNAELCLRDKWQRIWTSVRVPTETNTLNPSLVIKASRGSYFFSKDWVIETGPIPSLNTPH